MKCCKWLLCSVVLGVVGTSSASLLAYEGFDYAASTTNDQVEGLNGGSGFSGAWVNSQPITGNANFSIVEGGDSWGALPVVGNRLGRPITGGKEYVARSLSADLDATPELWFSVLWNPSSNEGFAIASDPIAEDGSVPDFLVGNAGAGFGFVNTDNSTCIAAVWDANGRTEGSSIAMDGSLRFIVGRIRFNASAGSDILDLYSVGTDLVLPGTAGATLTADLDETILDTLTMESNRGPGYDEIRIGTTLEDVGVTVIPEPATLGVVAFFGSAILWIRRRLLIC